MENSKIKVFLKNSGVIVLCFLPWYAWGASPVVIPEVSLTAKNNLLAKPEPYHVTTRFTQSELINTPVVDLGQLLKQEQSMVRLTNNSADANQTALSIRGFGENAAANSLILVDGFLLTNASLLAPNFNSIPLLDIERIDILQGSAGSLWGSQAVGGVVNIVTRHPKKFFVNSIMSMGSYNHFYETILVGDKAANGLFYKLFGLVDNTHNYRKQNKQNGNNLAVQGGIDYPRGTVSLNEQSYRDTTYFPGGLSEKQFKQNPRQATLFDNYSNYHTQLFQLLNKQAFTDEWLLETRLNHQATTRSGLIYSPFTSQEWLTSISPRLIGMLWKSKIIIGYEGQMSHYALNNQKLQEKTAANQNDFYTQTTIPVTEQVDLILGVRNAWQNSQNELSTDSTSDGHNSVFVTEQGIQYHPNQTLTLFVRRDGNFSFPKANEETWLPTNIKTLRVQTGTSYEIGSEWHTKKYRTQLRVYRLELNNEIAFDPTLTPWHPFGAFNNLDKTIREGTSLFESYYLTARTTLNGQINYVNARFKAGINAGKLIPAVPALNGNIGLNYGLTERWATQYTLLYTGNQYPSQDVANEGKKIPSYWLSDVALQYFMPLFVFSFEIHNLFDKKYPSNVFYSTFSQQNIYYPAAGRNYSLTVKISID